MPISLITGRKMEHFDVVIIGVDKNKAYHKATRKLRIKLYGKILKSRVLTSALTRKWIMQSGMAHIPLGQEVEPAVTPDGLIKEH